MPDNFTNGFLSPVLQYELLTDHNEYEVSAHIDVDGFHVGENWVGQPLSPAQAMGNGTVVFAGYSAEFGANLVVIEHIMPDGTTVTSYSGNLDTVDVSVGDQVAIGQAIGTIETLGSFENFYDPPHLHLAIYIGEDAPVIPPDYLDAPDGTPTTGFVDPSDFIAANPPTNVLPDLAISGLQVNDDIWHDADSIQTSWTVDNNGLVETGEFTTRLYLSTDTTITTDDILISGHSLNSLSPLDGFSSYGSDWEMISPASLGLPEGTYYIGVIVDPDNLIAEEDETNNVSEVVEVTLSNSIVNFVGTENSDILIGTDDNNRIVGLTGGDIILGQGGDDQIVAWDGSNYLFGQDGNDSISGGENSDLIFGGDGDDWLLGLYGRDRIFGGDGNDTVLGSRGIDFLAGGNGDDALSGDYGDDVLVGGAGDDVMKGGGGYDTFVYNDGMDVILDFYIHAEIIALDADALGITGLTAEEVINDYGALYNNQAALNFGNGDILFFQDVTDVTELTDNIVFF